MPKKHVAMNETAIMPVTLSETDRTAKLHTSALAGCLAVLATFESGENTTLFLSHHSPSGNAIEAARKLEPKIRELMEQGYQPATATVIRPGEHHQSDQGWAVRVIDTTQPDVEGYSRALGLNPIEVVYVPDHLVSGFNKDKEWGPGTAAIQVALEGREDQKVTRAYSEGMPINVAIQRNGDSPD